MACLDDKSSKKSARAFCVFTALCLLLVLATFIFGLMHRSEQPEVLGRYSLSYGLLMLVLFSIVVYLSWVFLRGGARSRNWTANLYALLISSLLVLLAVEWGLRAFNPFGVGFFHNLPYHMQGMVDDPLLGYRHPSSVTYMLGSEQVTINAHGLRDDEVPYDKPRGEKRILVLGDSVVFGWGVSQGQTLSDHMESLLNEQTGGQWQVMNAGVNGYNTQQQATFLRVEGMRYLPDYVLLIYVSNDVDAVLDPNETTWRRYPSWPPSLPEAINRLRQLSYLFQLTKLLVRMERMDQARAAALTDDSPPSAREIRSLTSHPYWSGSKTALLDIARQCRQAGIPFLVALHSTLEGSFDPAFIGELQDAGIDAIHLRSAWRGIPPELAYVSRIDPHPSDLVHEKMANFLVDTIRRRGWLDES